MNTFSVFNRLPLWFTVFKWPNFNVLHFKDPETFSHPPNTTKINPSLKLRSKESLHVQSFPLYSEKNKNKNHTHHIRSCFPGQEIFDREKVPRSSVEFFKCFEHQNQNSIYFNYVQMAAEICKERHL